MPSLRTRQLAIYAGSLAALAAALTATAFPRLMLLGGLPATDEGVYAYYAQLIHASLSAGNGLPGGMTLALYPMTLAWIFALHTNAMIALRMADLIVALVASWLLVRVLAHESRSRVGGALIALVFLFTMNDPVFIQNGFKNSLFAAYVPLLGAWLLVRHRAGGSRTIWYWAGGLAALAVLMRETFVPFLILGGAAVLISAGWRAALRFTLAAALTALVVVAVIAWARGGVASLIDAYRNAGALYNSLADQRVPFFINNGIASAKVAKAALCLTGLGMLTIGYGLATRNGQVGWGQLMFWLGASLVPLIEPATKIGFPYHFSVCLPGLAGLTALGWRSLGSEPGGNVRRAAAVVAILAAAGAMWPSTQTLARSWPTTRLALQAMGTGTWPAEANARSNYLAAAAAIRQIARPGDTLGASGFMFALYPLTGLLPSSENLSNLSATLIEHNLDGDSFRQALLACPPTIVMTTARADWPGADILEREVAGSGIYQPVEVIAVDYTREYGLFGGTIYRRSRPAPPCGNATPAIR
jgi:hypothetical protein